MQQETRFISQTFDKTDLMRQSSPNWAYEATYTLLPQAFEGKNSVVFLPQVQLSYATRSGGILYEVASPKGTISLGVVEELEDKACFGHTKLKEGRVVIFDDKKPYSMVTNGRFRAAIVSFPKKAYRELSRELAKHNLEAVEDSDNRLQKLLEEILKRVEKDPSVLEDEAQAAAMEEEVMQTVTSLFEEQTPALPKLTKGEKIALQIRDRIYKRLSKKVTIASLAQEYGVSEQTLQNAFKSLFGFTPSKFLRNLKLNHVRRALIKADPQEDAIVHIAKRWGFTHMGHFSRYFTDLFGENPSVTLKRKSDEDETGK